MSLQRKIACCFRSLYLDILWNGCASPELLADYEKIEGSLRLFGDQAGEMLAKFGQRARQTVELETLVGQLPAGVERNIAARTATEVFRWILGQRDFLADELNLFLEDGDRFSA